MFVLIPTIFELWVDGRDCYLYDHGSFTYMGSIRKGESLPISQKFPNAYTVDNNVWRFDASVSNANFRSMFNILDSTVTSYFNEHTMFFAVSYPSSTALLEGGRKFNTAFSSGLSANPSLPVLDGIMFEQDGMKVIRKDLQWVPDFTTQPEPGCCWVSNGQWTLWIPPKYLAVFPNFAMEIAMGILDLIGEFLNQSPEESLFHGFVDELQGAPYEPSVCVQFPDNSVWGYIGSTWHVLPKMPELLWESISTGSYKVCYKRGAKLDRALSALKRTLEI